MKKTHFGIPFCFVYGLHLVYMKEGQTYMRLRVRQKACDRGIIIGYIEEVIFKVGWWVEEHKGQSHAIIPGSLMVNGPGI